MYSMCWWKGFLVRLTMSCRRPVERLQCRVDKLSLLTDKVDMYDVRYLFRVWYYKNDRLIRIIEDTADSSNKEQVTLAPQGLVVYAVRVPRGGMLFLIALHNRTPLLTITLFPSYHAEKLFSLAYYYLMATSYDADLILDCSDCLVCRTTCSSFLPMELYGCRCRAESCSTSYV